MAFNNLGEFTSAPGVTIHVVVWFHNYESVGAQYIAAFPQGPAPFDMAFIVNNQKWVLHEYNPYNGYTYECDVYNASVRACSFTLCGGGFS